MRTTDGDGIADRQESALALAAAPRACRREPPEAVARSRRSPVARLGSASVTSPVRAPGRRVAAAAAAAIALLATIASLTTPAWLFPRDAALLASTQTLAGVAALAASWLALLRGRRTGAGGDIALAIALGTLSLTSLLLAAIGVVAPAAHGAIVDWLSVPGRLLSAALLLLAGVASFAPTRVPGRLALTAATVALACALAGGGALLGALANARVPDVLELAGAGLYLLAAAALGARARAAGDAALGWLAAASLALGISRLAQAISAQPAGEWLSSADVARLAASVLLLAAVRVELIGERARAVERGVAKERRRLAREIHDGLAQELAFIVSQSRSFATRTPSSGELATLAAAGESALADARRAIFELKRPSTQALSTTIVEKAFTIAERAGVALEVEVEGEVRVAAEAQHAILRIVNEAVSNAVRHAGASIVSVRICADAERVIVRVVDDGSGFDPRPARRRRSVGVTSMTERAESLGGALRLERAPGGGTMVEVAL